MQLPANSMGLIYGRSGAGKTTLLKIIGGLAQQHAGDVAIGPEAVALDAGPGAASSNGSAASQNSSGPSASSLAGPVAASLAAARTMQVGRRIADMGAWLP